MDDARSDNSDHVDDAFGRPFEIEDAGVNDGGTGEIADGIDMAPDGYIKDLERIPTLKELWTLWQRSMSRILPHRRAE